MGGLLSRAKPGDGDPAPQPGLEELLVRRAKAMKVHPDNTEPVVISRLVTKEKDGSELQWVHLIMAGGGMLGIAHVGFVRVLELAGIRFLGLGGTSAGAINAAFIAAVRDTPKSESWDKLKKVMDKCPFATFEDGDGFFKKLRKKLTKSFSMLGLCGTVLCRPFSWRKIAKAWEQMGIHEGSTFRKWLADNLRDNKINNTKDLMKKLQLSEHGVRIISKPLDNQEHRDVTGVLDKAMQDRSFPLKLVAAELTTQTMVVFPRDADLFYADADGAPPADFVRASMSVPYFFKPFQLPYTLNGEEYGLLLDAQTGLSATWKDRNGFEGAVPSQAVFCDGGTLSNFPMGLFYAPPVEGAPALGITLGPDRKLAKEIKGMKAFISSKNDTSRHLLDREFLLHNPEYREWIATVDTSGFDWLEFEMTENQQKRLFLRGMTAGVKFLEKFRKPSSILDTFLATRIQNADRDRLISQLTAMRSAEERERLIANMNLEAEYNRDVAPAMVELARLQQRLGDQWAEGVFFPTAATEAELKAIDTYRRVLQTFWRKVQAAYEPKPGRGLPVLTDAWWTPSWAGRGRQYRLIVEPLDIANWYYINNQTPEKGSGHYIDGIGPSLDNELTTNNHKRPGRYLMLQQREDKVFGRAGMQSSLAKARKLKEEVGNKSWKEYMDTLGDAAKSS